MIISILYYPAIGVRKYRILIHFGSNRLVSEILSNNLFRDDKKLKGGRPCWLFNLHWSPARN
jgi:hypothetical protein